MPPDPTASLLATNLLPDGSKTFGSGSRTSHLYPVVGFAARITSNSSLVVTSTARPLSLSLSCILVCQSHNGDGRAPRSEARPPQLCNFDEGLNQLKFPVLTHLAEIIVHQSLAKPWVTYLYDSHPYPAFAQLIPHEFRTSSAPLSLPIMRLSS